MEQLTLFRFHTGSIKRAPRIIPDCLILMSFDSILVRLKANPTPQPSACLTRFDSILVRLKEQLGNAGKLDYNTFRFHTGSIKSKPRRTTLDLSSAVSIPYWFD